MTRSPPPACALMTSEPPSCAIFTSPEISAAIVREPPSIETSSTSSPFSVKMPFSFAYHCERLSQVMLLYATFSETTAGFGVDEAVAAAGALGAGAGAALPPHDRMTRLAATIATRARFTTSHLHAHLNRLGWRRRTIVSTRAGMRFSI